MAELIVVGGGPGGYAAAIRGAQLGLRVTLVEREAVGGVCLNWGCIPSKALLRNAEVLELVRHAADFGIQTGEVHADYGQAIDRSRQVVERLTAGVNGLMKANGITVIGDEGVVTGPGEVHLRQGNRTITGDHVLIAVGSRPKLPPGVGLVPGRVVTYRQALEEREMPRSALIIGGGAIGCEFATIWRAYGAEVTIVEMATHLLPQEDEDCSQALARAFTKRGIKLQFGTKVRDIDTSGPQVAVTLETDQGAQVLHVDKVLVAIGARPNGDGVGADALGLTNQQGFLEVDEQHRTKLPGVSAIGDVTGPLLLAHVATQQGIRAVDAMAGQNLPPLDYRMMPRATYSHPEVASMGLTEREARETGYEVIVGRFPFQANGRALALGDATGFVKIVAEARHHELLGVHLVGPNVSELLAEPLLAVNLEATIAEIDMTVHPHPTLSEAIKEAAMAATGQAIHLPPRQQGTRATA